MKADAKRNLDILLALLSPDPDVVVIGTGIDEKRISLSEIKLQVERYWSQSDAVSMRTEPHLVSKAGKVAWVTADLAFHVKARGQPLVRRKVVHFRNSDVWKKSQDYYRELCLKGGVKKWHLCGIVMERRYRKNLSY